MSPDAEQKAAAGAAATSQLSQETLHAALRNESSTDLNRLIKGHQSQLMEQMRQQERRRVEEMEGIAKRVQEAMAGYDGVAGEDEVCAPRSPLPPL